MSSIRLYILGALADEGEMHGHQLRQLAEKEHIDEWTEVTVGGLYGALKRLAAEGLIEEARTERSGSYPERLVWRITRAGSIALAQLREQGLREIVYRADPFDLAMSRPDLEQADRIPDLVAARLSELRAMLASNEARDAMIEQYLSPLEQHVMQHKAARLRADIAWLEELVSRLPELLAHEKSRKDDR
ncbi:PadR family transcriptional regulator [Pseudolysinimonas sp.]|uniref:PadR family transcriptional regulator n=1 Tax=Pseudolysinimonas sp. TaxID=2680009 RepID=UPI003F7E24F5